jgi:hypothetical protein
VHRRLVLVVVLTVAFVAACGPSDVEIAGLTAAAATDTLAPALPPSPTPTAAATPTLTPVPTPAFLAEDQLAALLLTTDDVPGSLFSEVPSKSGVMTGERIDMLLGEVDPGVVGERESLVGYQKEFTARGGAAGGTIENWVIQFQDEQSASAFLQGYPESTSIMMYPVGDARTYAEESVYLAWEWAVNDTPIYVKEILMRQRNLVVGLKWSEFPVEFTTNAFLPGALNDLEERLVEAVPGTG